MLHGNISPNQIINEAVNYNKKLMQGMINLMDIEEIPSGVTEKEEIYSEDKLKLYHYKPHVKQTKKNKTPLLIVYALVNRPYMTDLQENRSLIRGLIEQGQEVYLIDWGYPDRADSYLTLDDYINGYIDNCVDVVREKHSLEKINILGICQGGAFSLCYTSLNPEKVKSLTTMVTPVDFHTKDNLLSHWVKNVDVDLVVDTIGNVSGDMMNNTFLSMRPFELTSQKYINMVDTMQNPKYLENFMRMEKWIFDSPDQAGEAYRQFIKEFYQKNLLIKGKVELDGKKVNLKNIKVPVLNIYAEDDNLVPPSASKPLKKYIGTDDYTELSFKGGHIGIYVSGRAQKELPPAIGKWLNAK